ncbi:NUDIX hydrolase [Levilactobacillus mulengensis]|uniref:NUDIX hydrolase n=1 Tax=Levilactobacillus mulengensis TaxID=2486025 RepID=UPI000F79488E|nr:NUDIX hydrolase [Levilactobacillus mulengensis]
MPDYIQAIRHQVGHKPIILTFAGGILVDRHDHVLLQKRTDFNRWGLPGGALEFGESASAACVREFREETGLTVAVTGLLGVSSNQIQRYPNGDVAQAVIIVFRVSLVAGQLKTDSRENQKLGYFAQDNLPPLLNAQHEQGLRNYFSGNIPWMD